MLAFDTETHLIKPGMGAPRCVCVQTNENTHTLYDREPGLDRVERALKEGEPLVGHHTPYDLGVTVAERPHVLPSVFEAFDKGLIHDTIIRQKIMDNATGELKMVWDDELEQYKRNPGYSMDALLYRHFGEVRAKGEDTWRLRYGELDGLPVANWPEDARDYALRDGSDTWRLYDRQDTIVKAHGVADGVIPGEKWTNQANWALHLMHLWGVRTDRKAAMTLDEVWVKEEKAAIKEAQKYGFIRKNGTRNLNKIKEAVEECLGEKTKKTAKGNVQTKREQLVATGHPGLLAVAHRVKIEKLRKTYLPVLLSGAEVPINASYNAILETFRTSCRNPNLQNVPRKGFLRNCFVPRKGWVFVFCDFDTLEMLTLGQVCLDLFGESKIVEAAIAGADFHLIVAAEMLKMPYSQAKALYDQGDVRVSDARQFCKIANYGFAGGMGASTFVVYAKGFGVELSLEMAKQLKTSFMRAWPEMSKYFSYCSKLIDRADKKAEKIQFVRSGLFRGNVSYTATCNGFFQHLAAMGAKDAVYEVARECYIDGGSPLYGCRPWLFAHDEIGMEVPYYSPEFAHRAAMRLQELMIERMQHWCPDVPIGATAAMSLRWIKGAKPLVRDKLLRPVRQEGREWVEEKMAA